MTRHLALAYAFALSLAPSPAQGRDADASTELRRAERLRQQNQLEVERLLDLRLRHDLGLPGDETDATFQSSAPATTDAMEKLRQELRDEEALTASTLDRYNKLRKAVEDLRAEATARARRDEQNRLFVEVPAAGTAPVRPTTDAARPDASPGPLSPAPAGESMQRPASTVLAETADLDPLRAQIHGSEDHQRVAQSLFKAGQWLMDRAAAARNQGRPDAARELDDRGKEKLVRALDELASLLQQQQPPFDALFYQGRCRELLFRYGERYDGLSLQASPRDFQRREQEVRDSFLAITARDAQSAGARGDAVVLGAWGMAAQSAMEHFRWMNLHAGYDAATRISALTWAGELKQ